MFESEVRLNNGSLVYVWADYEVVDDETVIPIIKQIWLYTDEENDVSEDYYPNDKVMEEIEDKIYYMILESLSDRQNNDHDLYEGECL